MARGSRFPKRVMAFATVEKALVDLCGMNPSEASTGSAFLSEAVRRLREEMMCAVFDELIASEDESWDMERRFLGDIHALILSTLRKSPQQTHTELISRIRGFYVSLLRLVYPKLKFSPRDLVISKSNLAELVRRRRECQQAGNIYSEMERAVLIDDPAGEARTPVSESVTVTDDNVDMSHIWCMWHTVLFLLHMERGGRAMFESVQRCCRDSRYGDAIRNFFGIQLVGFLPPGEEDLSAAQEPASPAMYGPPVPVFAPFFPPLSIVPMAAPSLFQVGSSCTIPVGAANESSPKRPALAEAAPSEPFEHASSPDSAASNENSTKALPLPVEVVAKKLLHTTTGTNFKERTRVLWEDNGLVLVDVNGIAYRIVAKLIHRRNHA